MRHRDRKVLDDLTEKESELLIDVGAELVQGVYKGMKRLPNGKWALRVHPPKRKEQLVLTSEIVSFKKVVL